MEFGIVAFGDACWPFLPEPPRCCPHDEVEASVAPSVCIVLAMPRWNKLHTSIAIRYVFLIILRAIFVCNLQTQFQIDRRRHITIELLSFWWNLCAESAREVTLEWALTRQLFVSNTSPTFSNSALPSCHCWVGHKTVRAKDNESCQVITNFGGFQVTSTSDTVTQTEHSKMTNLDLGLLGAPLSWGLC